MEPPHIDRHTSIVSPTAASFPSKHSPRSVWGEDDEIRTIITKGSTDPQSRSDNTRSFRGRPRADTYSQRPSSAGSRNTAQTTIDHGEETTPRMLEANDAASTPSGRWIQRLAEKIPEGPLRNAFLVLVGPCAELDSEDLQIAGTINAVWLPLYAIVLLSFGIYFAVRDSAPDAVIFIVCSVFAVVLCILSRFQFMAESAREVALAGFISYTGLCVVWFTITQVPNVDWVLFLALALGVEAASGVLSLRLHGLYCIVNVVCAILLLLPSGEESQEKNIVGAFLPVMTVIHYACYYSRETRRLRLMFDAARYMDLFSATFESLIVVNLEDGTIADVNPAMERLFTITRSGCLHRSVTDLFSFDQRRVVAEKLTAARMSHFAPNNIIDQFKNALAPTHANTFFIESFTTEIVSSDGSRIPVALTGKKYAFGGVAKLVLSVRDLRTQQKLKRADKRARAAIKASQAKSTWLSTISHEFRTPLNAILGMVQLIEASEIVEHDEEAGGYFGVIGQACDSLLCLVNDLLDYSKIEAGKLQIEKIGFDVVSVIENSLEFVAEKAYDKKLDIAVHICNTIPGSVLGDPTRIRQVMLNLLSNAIKFTQEGHVLVVVKADEWTAGSFRMEASVIDSGVGISQTNIKRLFRLYEQADKTIARKFGGTGLGLVISQELSRLMGGDVVVESIPGVGSTFKFSAILDLVTPRDPYLNYLPERAKIARTDEKNLIVCYADEEVGKLIAMCLSDWGFSATLVLNLQDAVALVKVQEYSLVILDDVLLDLGLVAGTDFGDVQILVATFKSHRVFSRHQLTAVNVAGTIGKPVRPSLLFHRVTQLLEIEPKFAATLSEEAVSPRSDWTESNNGGGDSASNLLAAGGRAGRRQSVLSENIANLSSGTIPELPTAPRLLVVDDTSVNLLVAQKLLNKLGYSQVDTALSGQIAVKFFEDSLGPKRPYSLVFMDMEMPEMNGVETAAEIVRVEKSRGREPPVIVAMTGHAKSDVWEECSAVGMFDAIQKPIKQEVLGAMVEKSLNQANSLAARSAVEQAFLADGLRKREGSGNNLRTSGGRKQRPRSVSVSAAVTNSVTRKISKASAPVSPVRERAGSNASETSGGSSQGGPQHILLVEDNPVNQMVATKLLEVNGYVVECSDNGAEGVRAWEANLYKYICILMDVQMPVMDGLEATRTIRARERALAASGKGTVRIPILAVTANAMHSSRKECIDAGMDDFILKPLRQDELLQKIKSHGRVPVAMASSSRRGRSNSRASRRSRWPPPKAWWLSAGELKRSVSLPESLDEVCNHPAGSSKRLTPRADLGISPYPSMPNMTALQLHASTSQVPTGQQRIALNWGEGEPVHLLRDDIVDSEGESEPSDSDGRDSSYSSTDSGIGPIVRTRVSSGSRQSSSGYR